MGPGRPDGHCNMSVWIKRNVRKHTLYCSRYVIEEREWIWCYRQTLVIVTSRFLSTLLTELPKIFIYIFKRQDHNFHELPFRLKRTGGETNVVYFNSETHFISLKMNKINYLILNLGQAEHHVHFRKIWRH